MTRIPALIAAATLAGAASDARAEVDLFSGEAVAAMVDLRVGAATGETSWTRAAYGKSQVSDGVTAEIARAVASWKPRVNWDWSGVVTAQFQPGQKHEVDLVEAYVTYKPVPSSPIRVSGRAGLFWPHISMEHGDAFWGVSNSITPSAINSWVGEEIKVLGVEGDLSAPVAGSRINLTAGVFGANDTAGTLLALRGWALHDRTTTAFSRWPLPKLPVPYDRIWRGQAPATEPTRHDIDDRLGFYGRVEWRPSAPFTANLFYYDNGGNPTRVESGQWGWDTRYWNAGAAWDVDDRTQLMAQTMWGVTIEGRNAPPQGVWINVHFASTYLSATHRFSDMDRLTVRGDYFRTRDITWQARDNNNEKGWATTVAWRRDLSPNLVWLTEVMHISSNRIAREYLALDRKQPQTVAQSSLRVMF